MLHNTSSYSAHSWLVSVLLFVALVCLAPRVSLLVLRLASVLSFHALCCTTLRVTLLILDFLNLSCFVLNTSTRSVRCSVVSGSYLKYTFTFLEPVLVRFWPLCRSNFVLLMLHSPELLSIRPFCHRFEFGFCLLLHVHFLLLSSVYIYIYIYTYVQSADVRFTVQQLISAARDEHGLIREQNIYIYIYIYIYI